MRVDRAAWVLALATMGCTATHRRTEWDGPAVDPDSLAAVAEAAADASDDLVMNDVVTAAQDSTRRVPPRATATTDRAPHALRGEIVTVTGVRTETRATLGIGRSISTGFRRVDAASLGYVETGGRGFFGGLVAGNVTLRMGERLVLGRDFMGYTALGSGGGARGMSVSPSLSRWFSRPGVALGFAAGRWLAQAALVGRAGDPRHLRPTTAWASLAYHNAAATLGVAAGTSLNPDPVADRLRVVSFHGSFRGEMLQCSGEVAMWFPWEPYFAIRISSPGSSTWAARYLRAPSFSTSKSAVDWRPNGTIEEGVAWDGGTRLGPGRWRASIFLGAHHSLHERRRVRRAILGVSDKHHGMTWEGSIASLDHARERAASIIEASTESSRDHEIRFHARITGSSRGEFSHTLTLDYRPRRRWHSEGLALAVATEITRGRFEAAWQGTAYTMAVGQGRLVTRPGVGGFEWASWVYGQGFDVALRVRVRLARNLTVTGYCGQPWLKEYRAYVGAQWAFQ
jgi:hypothetical protein